MKRLTFLLFFFSTISAFSQYMPSLIESYNHKRDSSQVTNHVRHFAIAAGDFEGLLSGNFTQGNNSNGAIGYSRANCDGGTFTFRLKIGENNARSVSSQEDFSKALLLQNTTGKTVDIGGSWKLRPDSTNTTPKVARKIRWRMGLYGLLSLEEEWKFNDTTSLTATPGTFRWYVSCDPFTDPDQFQRKSFLVAHVIFKFGYSARFIANDLNLPSKDELRLNTFGTDQILFHGFEFTTEVIFNGQLTLFFTAAGYGTNREVSKLTNGTLNAGLRLPFKVKVI